MDYEEDIEVKECNEYQISQLVSFTDKLSDLPTDLIIMALECVLKIEPLHGWDTIDAILNIEKFDLLMSVLVATGEKNAFDLMNTRLWIAVLATMGYNFTNKRLWRKH